jgi:hypothetical protein
MGATKGTSQRVTQLGTFANMGREQQGNNWERFQTWEESNKGTIGNVCKHGNRATREQLGTFANMGTEQQGNVPIGERERERERERRRRRQTQLREFCVWSRLFGGRHRLLFFFVFFFFAFFPPHGCQMVCVLFAAQSVCVCVCVFFWRGRYFEFVILALLFPQCLCCCRLHVFQKTEARRILNIILHTNSSGRERERVLKGSSEKTKEILCVCL